MPARIRVGIDVGGTFTDAVAIDAQTLELVGQVKVPTTHHHPEGVAHGIVEALTALLARSGHASGDVGFLAHGTTQATNALLEGDVAHVGIVGLGRGFTGWRTRRLARGHDIELARGKHLRTSYAHAPGAGAAVGEAVRRLVGEGSEVVVAAEAFSVDDPAGEDAAASCARELGAIASTSHEITKLYGLKTRVRTAVINASILPRMLGTAELVDKSIKAAGITSPLMVMRCDGGVMDLEQMRRRPLLTVLSGPAAGVAGALMSERIGEGIFLETGGTSTDISVIRRGRVAVRHAEIGGYRTFLTSLDVRTIGVGGGSLIRVRGGKVTEAGPRSAHIAGLSYAGYADPAALRGAELVSVRPKEGDPDDYVAVDGEGGRFALTTSCAALALELVPETDYAHADPAAARLAFAPLAKSLGVSVAEAAREVLRAAVRPVRDMVESLVREYRLDRRSLVLVGGGGGAASVTPFLAAELGAASRIAAHNEVISPIGVALAMVREQVERVVPDPGQADVLAIRREAEQAVVAQGARAESVEVDVVVDPRRNTVRAVATGATELRTKDVGDGPVAEEQARATAAESARADAAGLRLLAETRHYRVYGVLGERRGPIRLSRRKGVPLRVVDREGVVRFQAPDGQVRVATCGAGRELLGAALEELTEYGDGGARLPALHLLLGGRIVNLAGMTKAEQVLGVAETEFAGREADEPVALISEARA
ncbi:hydantoinase/oxoprolinase family protein [Amycolatopsis alkalitolerans]|uniref:Hydantoinase/oxoprolinase family protein n=1 Tax=Amycolatopsis alkalitolerans TaxID=2547244 RepID=A0A5C4M019_9PSEU|nr:hydantoinase/oxoprolinase family protein [Amycolatopsis alkalitolerans]TNC24109.1 hydantoinase/oxoprolinase family protein [Amycolatopsis alkalitolerans]